MLGLARSLCQLREIQAEVEIVDRLVRRGRGRQVQIAVQGQVVQRPAVGLEVGLHVVAAQVVQAQVEGVVEILSCRIRLGRVTAVVERQVVEAEAIQLVLRQLGAGQAGNRGDRDHCRVARLELLDLRLCAADFAQLVFLASETFAIAHLGIDFHQLEAQVGALRLVVDGVLQQFSGLVETPVGDIDVGLAQRIGSLRSGLLDLRRSGCDLRLRLVEGQVVEAVLSQVQRILLFLAGIRGESLGFFLLFLRIAPRQDHQQHQQRQQCATADHRQPQRVGQQFVEEARCRLLCRLYRSGRRNGRCRRLLGSWRGRRRHRRLRRSGGCFSGWSRSRRCRSGSPGLSRRLRCCIGLGRIRQGCVRLGCALAFGAQLPLQLGQLGVLQLDQLLQLVQLALQILHAALQFFVLAASAIEAFLGHRQGIGERLAVALPALVGTLAGLALARHQAQVVRGVDLGWRRPGGIALGRIQLPGASAARGRIAAAAPALVLRLHLGQRLARRALQHLLFGGNAQDLAALQPVDVAIDEGARIQFLEREHRLGYGNAIGTVALGDLPERVVGNGAIGVAACRRGGTHRSRSLRGSRGAGRARRADRRLRSACRGLRGVQRRIQQDGVLAQQAAVRPEHLDQEVQVGLLHRLRRGHANDALAVGLHHRRELQVGEVVQAIDARLAELFRRRQARDHLARTQVTNFEQLDLGIQRLVQRRLQGDFPQSQSMRHAGSQDRGRRDCPNQCTKPNHSVIPWF
ncbi:hypothetical protein PAERUG_P5_London_26_VIM_2_01_09_01161 [Pseudomonas aeruginosa]|nr:hypothetical protein PAERUG_E2_London_17_VIM_2_02_09_00674 [Pseudomonas aeruginosa]CRR56139.1 hypothetical protein PAERUG_P5_London_26_VIM_2_01_09_01161 [Pseudomonas aeruginosa]